MSSVAPTESDRLRARIVELEAELARRGRAEILLSALPDVISRFGPDLRFRYISPGVQRLTGIAAEHYIGKTHVEAGLPPEVARRLEECLQQIFDSGMPATIDFSLQAPSSDTRYLVGSGVPEIGPDGSVSSVITVLRDVTDHKRDEERIAGLNLDLARRIREFETLLEVLPVGIAVANNADCTDIRMNPTFARMLGMDSRDNASKTGPQGPFLPFRVVSNGREVPDDELPMQRAARERCEIHDVELEIVRADGSTVTELCFAKPLFDEQQNVRGSIGVFLDITERKLARDLLEASHESLRVANEDLQQFAYAAAHDLQEPLRNISLYTQLLAKRYSGVLDEDGESFLEFVKDGAVRMQQLVRDLLAYTKVVDAVEHDLAEPVDSSLILQQVLDGLRVTLGDAQAEITRGDLPLLAVHPLHLTQLFQNLISNAVKYSVPGIRPQIHISAEESERGFSVVCVSDKGIGIPPEFQERVFGVFKRLHGNEVPGTGIGLAICKKIVDYYGGHIWVESEGEEKGSRFCFSLPIA